MRTDRPNVSRSNISSEPVSDRHSRRPINQEILLRERIDGSATEEKNKDPLEEKHAIEYGTGDTEVVTERKNDDGKATVLPLPVLSRKASKTCISPVPLGAVIRKRRSEKNDQDLQVTLNFKKPRGRTKQPKNLTGCRSTVGAREVEKSDPTSKLSPSDFQASSQYHQTWSPGSELILYH